MATNSPALGKPAEAAPMTKEEKRVVFASSLGTIFEWYDFYLFGAMSAIIARNFFSGLDESTRIIFVLLAFAAGFVGAAVWRHRLRSARAIVVGRKYTFLVTILIMGVARPSSPASCRPMPRLAWPHRSC